jgi:hypothetical protein
VDKPENQEEPAEAFFDRGCVVAVCGQKKEGIVYVTFGSYGRGEGDIGEDRLSHFDCGLDV